jgi:hypothetical protein
MQVIKRIKQLVAPRQNLVGRKRPLLLRHHLREVLAVDKLHHEKLPLTLCEMIADARQGWMVHSGQQPGLSLKLLSQSFIFKQSLFKRYVGIEALVDGFVNGPHAALPKQANDPITAL